jgi:uncharacterized membrane protein
MSPSGNERLSGSANTPESGNPEGTKSLPDIIPPEAVEVLRKAGIDSPEKAAAVITVAASVSRSPYPSPEMLRAYEDFRPGMADQVLQQVHEQRKHRQNLEKLRTKGSERRMNHAQRNSLIIAILSIFLAAGAAYYSTIVAGVIAVVGVGGPSAATILARYIDPRAG